MSARAEPGAPGMRSEREHTTLASERIKRFSESAIATPANFVTGARLLLAVPTLLLIEDRGSTWLTVSLWFVLACTDRLDGWLRGVMAPRGPARFSTRSPTSSS